MKIYIFNQYRLFRRPIVNHEWSLKADLEVTNFGDDRSTDSDQIGYTVTYD